MMLHLVLLVLRHALLVSLLFLVFYLGLHLLVLLRGRDSLILCLRELLLKSWGRTLGVLVEILSLRRIFDILVSI
jgi:hypothetical protein